MKTLVLLAACLSLVGCASVAAPDTSRAPAASGPVIASASPAPSSTTLPLITEDRGFGCFRFGIGRVRVEADPNAPEGEAVWLTTATDERIWPIWPVGFTAVMDPDLRIIDADGQTVVTEGQWFEAGGSPDGETGAYVCSVDDRTYT